jgi:hypothetical protein
MIGEVYVIRHDVNLHSEILGMYCTTLSLSLSPTLSPYLFLSFSLIHFSLPLINFSFLLHLDTPDFFWKEDASVEDEYK